MKYYNETGPCVVIVDDSDEDAELATRILKKENMAATVMHFYDGAQGLAYLFSKTLTKPPQLVLLDLEMPGMHGLEVLTRMKEDLEKRMIPVVVMSSCTDDHTIAECYLRGVNGYMRKHTQYEKLRDEIKSLGGYWLSTNYLPGTSMKSAV